MEPAGALAVAGAAKYLKQHGLVGVTVAAVTSGANIDFDRLRFVSERADSSETLISVTIPEQPGESRPMAAAVGRFRGGSNGCGGDAGDGGSGGSSGGDRAVMIELVAKVAAVCRNLWHATSPTAPPAHCRDLAHVRSLHALPVPVRPPSRRAPFPVPGAFRALYRHVFPRNVTEFSYRYHDGEAAQILLSYQSLPGTARASDAEHVLSTLAGAGYSVLDLSNNELAKVRAAWWLLVYVRAATTAPCLSLERRAVHECVNACVRLVCGQSVCCAVSSCVDRHVL
jgi:C-terminal regulatory domain of Threonine dehydratase